MLESAVKTYKDTEAWNETPELKEESFESYKKQAGEIN